MQFQASAAERVCHAVGRFLGVTVPFLLMVLTALAWALVAPTPAYAADAQIDSFTINYEMQSSGVLKVKETIVWRFGSNTGRHGMQRHLVIREPDPDSDQDFVYGISNIKVTSPNPGVATQFSSQTTESQGGREAELNLRIGDPNQTISAPTATYVISYDVTGAMRSFNGYDEFYWDGTGFGNPLIKELTITTTVPGGHRMPPVSPGRHRAPLLARTRTSPRAARPASPRPMSHQDRASVSGSRSRQVWWRTTSLTWRRTAQSFHPPKAWVRWHWLR